jgi:hypothetical protein
MAQLGGCLCGQIRFALSGEFRLVEYCHCRSCRRSVGAPVVAWAAVAEEGFEVLSGDMRSFESSPGVERTFCGRCGASLTIGAEAYANEIYVSLMALDDADAVAPQIHIWRSERVPWFDTNDTLPRFLGFKRDGELEA